MGRMSLVISTTAFFTVLLIYPVGMFINLRLNTWKERGVTGYYFGCYWKYLLLTSIVASIVMSIIDTTSGIEFHMDLMWLLVLICGSLLFNTANQTVIPSLNLFNARGWFIGLTLLTIAVGFLFSLLLAQQFGARAEVWLLGPIFGQMLFALVGEKILFREIFEPGNKGNFSVAQISILLAFAWPVTLSAGLNWAQTQGYRFLLENETGLISLGFFFAGYGVSAGLMSATETILATYFQPRFYKKISGGLPAEQSAAWKDYAQIMIPAILLTGIFVAVLAQEIARLLLAPPFWSAAAFVIWGAGAETLRAIAGIFGLIAHAKMNTRLLLLPHLLGAVVALSLTWYWLPVFGAEGVGAALVTAGSITLLSMMRMARSQMKIALSPRRLLWCAGFGASLFVLAAGFRLLAEESFTIWATLSVIAPLGFVFGIFQLLMLRPYFKNGKEPQ